MRSHQRGDGPPIPRRVTRARPDLSPTKAPAIAADAALWPDWVRLPIQDLGFVFPGLRRPMGGN